MKLFGGKKGDEKAPMQQDDEAGVGLRPAEQFDIADDFGAGLARPQHRRMRLRIGVRDAGRQNQRGDAAPIDLGEILQRHLAGDRLAHRRTVVPGQHLGAAGGERLRRGAARARQTEDRDAPAGKSVVGDHRR